MLSSSSLAEACTAATFKPSAFGTEIISVQANLVTNYSASSPYFLRYVAPTVELRDSTFCNVTISYTHPGQDDEVFVETWLPIENPTWNGRFQAVGGGGWQAGRYDLSYGNMIGALADGFATVTTDAGLGSAELPTSWGLKSPGNINWPLFLNFAADSLIDEAVLGKQIVKNLYGQGPEYSYWNGCSQGGRQGLMLAQRYPTAYDGIAAAAPAIYIPEFLPIIQWPQQIMNELGHYPFSCELDAIRAAAIAACDDLDGLADGVINRNYQCLHTFDPYSLVGQTIKCAQPLNGTEIQISEAAAAVVNASWTGMTTEKGKVTWPGFRADADLTGNDPTTLSGIGIAKTTNCTLAGGCVGDPNSLGTQWLGLFVAKDPDFDYLNLTRAEWDDLVFYGIQQLDSIWGTADPDLSRFRDAGGKMVTFHGLVSCASGCAPFSIT